MGSRTPIDKRLAAELFEELRACTGYFNRATIIARDLKVLGSLAFSAVGKLTCGLYVPSRGRSYLGSRKKLNLPGCSVLAALIVYRDYDHYEEKGIFQRLIDRLRSITEDANGFAPVVPTALRC